jgi:phosphoribosylformylglycinamidine synthase
MRHVCHQVPIESFAPTGEDAVPQAVFTVPVLAEGRAALEQVNAAMGLGFDDHDLSYYLDLFVNTLKR